MKIAIDLQACQTDSRDRGIGRYAFSLAQAMVRLERSDIVLMLDGGEVSRMRDIRARLRSENVAAPALSYHYPTQGPSIAEGNAEVVRGAALMRARTLAALQVDAVLVSNVFEGFHGGAGISTSLESRSLQGVAKVAIAYDLIPLIFAQRYLPEHSEYTTWFRRKLRELLDFDLLLAISESTRRDLIELAGVDPDRIHVIGAGLDESFVTAASVDHDQGADLLRGRGICQPFVLTVGNGDWRKNNEGALRAFLRLPEQLRRTHQLVLTQVGSQFTKELKGEFASIADRVVVLGKVDDRLLHALYRRCAVFLFPSRYEGFGLPVLEAMAFGAAVVSSNAGALKEVLRSEDASFDPDDADQAAQVLERALSDASFRARLMDGAAEHARSFTWDRCARLARDAIDRLSSARDTRSPSPWQPSGADVSLLADAVAVSPNGLESLRRGLSAIVGARRRRILIDMTCVVQTETRTGIQRVVRNYCIGLCSWAQENPDVEVIPFCWADGGGVQTARGFARNGLGLDMPGADEPLQAQPNDVVFMLDSTWEWPERFDPFLDEVWSNAGEVVWMVYDLVPVRVPETCHPGMPPVFRHWLTHAVRRTDGFICISEATRSDLEAYIDEVLPIGARRPWSRSLHLGSDLESGMEIEPTAQGRSLLEAIGARPYLLAVGTVEPRKDYDTILRGFEAAWQRGVDVALVIVGKAGWNVEALVSRLQNHTEAGRRLFWIQHANDGDLQLLIRRTTGLVQASRSEGFGLPVVEAGSQGVPLILSDIPVFREIAGDEAIYFPVGDGTALADLIQHGATNGGWPRPAGIQTMTWLESSARLMELLRW